MSDQRDIHTMITTLEARQAVIEVLHRYGHTMDGQDPQGWADCFAADGSWRAERQGVPATRLTGRDELIAGAKSMMARTVAPTKHVVADPVITVTAGEASAVSYFLLVVAADSGPYLRATGTYRDRLRRDGDGQWRITDRVCAIESFQDGAPA